MSLFLFLSFNLSFFFSSQRQSVNLSLSASLVGDCNPLHWWADKRKGKRKRKGESLFDLSHSFLLLFSFSSLLFSSHFPSIFWLDHLLLPLHSVVAVSSNHLGGKKSHFRLK